MRVFGSLYKDNEVITREKSESDISNPSEALMECLEHIYKMLDVSEPVWVKKHANDLARYHSTKFKPEDFTEKVDFDYLLIEYYPD